MTIVFILIVVFTGSLIALQGVVNAYLGQQIGNPLQAGLISFGLGFFVLLVLVLLQRAPFSVTQLANTPKIALIGGLLGCVYVVSVIYIVPKVGIASTVIAALCGQIILSVIMDHFGFLNLQVSRISVSKVLGVGFVLVGVVLVNLQKFQQS